MSARMKISASAFQNQTGWSGDKMAQRPRARSNLDSRGNRKMGKSISNGFGIVRLLTPASQAETFKVLDKAKIPNSKLQRKTPFHATVLGFIGMNRREQTVFHAGFSVARLEQRLEDGVNKESPRKPLVVELGAVAYKGNFLYATLDDPVLIEEQVQLAGQVALHGISPARIDRQVVSPHIGLGYSNTGPIEEIREQVEAALIGTTAVLQRWNVYPERYS